MRKEINPACSLEGLTLKLKLQCLEGQGNLACCSPWGCKELDTTKQLNNKSIPWVAGILESSITVSKMRELRDSKSYLGFLSQRHDKIGSRILGPLHFVTQSCSTLCDPIDYTVHGILQARILEWVAFPFSRGSSQPRDQTQVFHIAG